MNNFGFYVTKMAHLFPKCYQNITCTVYEKTYKNRFLKIFFFYAFYYKAMKQVRMKWHRISHIYVLQHMQLIPNP